jgi:pSer/pThr/pTyr-binding forkhead associated (FHA) protein
MPKLLLKFNAAVIKEIPFDKASFSVGRKPDNDIVIDNPAISGHHCKIALEGGTYFVEDLDSTNGTYVNQKRVKKSGLHHNDVVSLAKHSLVFVEENPAPEPSKPTDAAPPADATMMLTPQKQEELIAQSASAAKEHNGKVGLLRVLQGVVAEPEYELKGMSTYIGKSDRVQVPIKGTGLFGSAPEVAASIYRKPEGYILVAVADGYPVVNGVSVNGSVPLKDGDVVDCGGTKMQFVLKETAA